MTLFTDAAAFSDEGAAGAPTDAKYLTVQAESGLSAEVSLGALTSGLLKHTVLAGVSTPATAVPGTDYLVPGWDLLEVQSQGSDVQTISITTAGDTDEQYLIIGSGKMKSGTLAIGFNNDATAPTYTTTIVSNGSNSASGTFIAGTYLGPIHFRIELDARTHDSGNRVGIYQCISNDNSTGRDHAIGGFKWGNTTDNITTIILKSSVAGGFLTGFKTKVYKRKVTS